uniref:Uncharacterized protein n=1 Tax=Desulfatirhabdium butyrativorans TaxID=340467 RepID=A0A7C4RT85_9BACT
MTNEEISRFFNTTRPFIQGNPNLRHPQVEGWFRTRQHFRIAMPFRRTDKALGALPQVTESIRYQDSVADELKHIMRCGHHQEGIHRLSDQTLLRLS